MQGLAGFGVAFRKGVDRFGGAVVGGVGVLEVDDDVLWVVLGVEEFQKSPPRKAMGDFEAAKVQGFGKRPIER